MSLYIYYEKYLIGTFCQKDSGIEDGCFVWTLVHSFFVSISTQNNVDRPKNYIICSVSQCKCNFWSNWLKYSENVVLQAV